MTAAPVTTVRSSDLSRDSAAVFRAADAGTVEVTRRDGEPLVLTRKSVLEQQDLVLRVACDLVAASLAPDERPFRDRLQDRFPWLSFLSPDEQDEFGREMVELTRSCAAVKEFTPFLAELNAWHRTAQAKAAGWTPTAELDWYDTPVPVPDPRSA